MYAAEAQDYMVSPDAFGHIMTMPGRSPLTILDIGAGEGTFLQALRRGSRRPIRAIGFTAVRSDGPEPEGIEWVYGDFQRPETWESERPLEPESVDVAVSNLTFIHMVHPLGALENAVRLLRPGGRLFADFASIRLDPETAPAAAHVICATLDHNRMSTVMRPAYDANDPLAFRLMAIPAYLQKRSELELGNIQPVPANQTELAYRYVEPRGTKRSRLQRDLV
jgi:SAM-dependent methyltransferase